MAQRLDLDDAIDWWNPRRFLVEMAESKFGYFREKIGSLEGRHISDMGWRAASSPSSSPRGERP